MACGPIISIDKVCASNAGGIKNNTWFWLQDNLLDYTVDQAAYVVDAAEFNDGTAAVLPVEFKYSKNVSNLGEEMVVDPSSENTTNTVTLTIQINRREYAKSKAVNVMASGARELVGLVPDKNGNYWFVTNMVLTGASSTTGAAHADANMYTLTFVAELDHMAYGVLPANIEELVTTGKFGVLS